MYHFLMQWSEHLLWPCDLHQILSTAFYWSREYFHFLTFSFSFFNLDIKGIHFCCWNGGGIRNKSIFCGGNLPTVDILFDTLSNVVLLFWLCLRSLIFIFLFGGQGRNADSLALYFGEDPARYPFEQGRLWM